MLYFVKYKNKRVIEDWDFEMNNPDFTPLTEAQIAFYNENPDAMPEEVENLQMNRLPELEIAKGNKLFEIQEYDVSDNVNGFFLNGNLMWLDKATRSSLFNTIEAAQLFNQERIAIWHNGISVDLELQEAKQLLSALELYANQCYSVTHQHIAAVQAMTDVTEINNFDVAADYPERLNITPQRGGNNA